MQYISRTRLLTLAFAAAALGLTVTVQESLNAQTTSLPPAIVIDDGDAGYAPGRFVKTNHPPAYGADASYYKNSPGVTSAATWNFTNLAVGTYDVYATWAPTSGFSTARYTITGANDAPPGKIVNQKAAPTTMTRGGYKWEKIGSVTLTALGTITLSVTPADAGFAQADAAMIVGSALSSAQPTTSSAPRCGDGIVHAGEQCDDGNQVATDGCSNACKTPVCGDGIVQPLSWQPEQCDDGNQSNEDACTNECKLARCGDGTKNGTEQCDNGAVGGPSCGPTCRLTVCGDKKVEGLEYCDDGNTANGDGCNAQCVTEAPAGADTQSLTSIELSCEGLVPYATVKYSKNHNNCVSLKKPDGTFANSIQFFCDGSTLSTIITKKVDMRQGIALASGDRVKLCHPMIMQPWGCTAEVTVTGTACEAVAAVCGNGVKQPGEECDDGNQSNTDACLNTCKPATCGDGFVRPGHEGCDDGNRDDTDLCANTCSPQRCGDGVTQGNRGENCDDANQNNGDACTNACKTNVCGDGHVKVGVEFCDDGNVVSGDGCSSNCRTETVHVCGNGIKTGNEQCDDGNVANGDGCSSTCFIQEIPPVGCGNGVLNPGEVCDNGAANVPSIGVTMSDRCTTMCRWERVNVCGNGVKEGTQVGTQTQGEQCDDGNSIDTDACKNNCMLPTKCGNGVKEAGEQCDDGNANNNDACTNACMNAKCLDGIVWTNVEGCDDGNNINTDTCSNVCTLTPVCGNGRQDYGEQCDDGNQVDSDVCKNNCTTPGTAPQIPAVCGNWIVEAGEQCEGFGGVRTPIPSNAALCCTVACRVESCGALTPTLPTPSNAPLTIRNVTPPELSRGIVLHGQVVALRFTATTGDKAVTIGRLQFKALQGNLQNGFALASLWEDTNNDGVGDGQNGREWQSTMQNGKYVFGGPVTIPANSTRTFDVLIAAEDYSLQDGITRTPQIGPVQIDFDTATTNYVSAMFADESAQLINISVNGACATAPCNIAVFTGPTAVNTYKTAGNLELIGEATPASAIQAGTSAPIIRFKARVSNDEDIRMYILPFQVEGMQAIENLSVKIDGVSVPTTTIRDNCYGLAPDSTANRWWGYWGTPEICASFDAGSILKRGTDTTIEVSATIKPRSTEWTSGTKVRLTAITDEDYFYAVGDTSLVPLKSWNTIANGGRYSFSGILSSAQHEAL